ncbi:hypothetical protein Caci_1548 [Catenulispora acidiphila DSM 44928]|uniref:Uncharacterized protein n=1 Tax=Catenulispora acidiphila (strain DSM 44928 / JCM 14897 / NBRC 102108 / NRRL B-24433 / ID139908) TaxID=479433 RepID=C7QA71_CATAD|nr:hypothetical protein [Catenulispora acidiphila]ACU70469.1 hypothetical protein Caci_1548 [Catenulispora acidiphila DSM 44928]
MEFAEWVVSGLDQLRLGQLPAGNDFYAVASAGLGGDNRLPAYMNSGDPAARAELVQVIAAAVAANPGFEQQLRDAAAAATQQPQGSVGSMPTQQAQIPVGGMPMTPPQGYAGAKPPFYKTTNGLLVIVAAAVVVVGGGIGLAVSLGGSGSGNLAAILKGTWACKASGAGSEDAGDGPLSFTVGDGTWTAGTASGTWTQNGSSATLHDAGDPTNDVKATHLPSGTGSFDVSVGSASDRSQLVSVHIKGSLSAHKLTIAVTGDSSGNLTLTCTK